MRTLLSVLFGMAMTTTLMGQEAYKMGGERECFFDDFLLDKSKTTMELRLHHPVNRGPVLVHDAPWEGDGCGFYNFFFDDSYPGFDGSHPNGVYRMYYLAWQMPSKEPNGKPGTERLVCYAESADGIEWVRPNLGIIEWNGSKENNIIVNGDIINPFIDNFMVFRDDNPACKPEERYKGIAIHQHKLWACVGPDGLHFKTSHIICSKGSFDSLNVVFWDERANIYRGYIRGGHYDPKGRPTSYGGVIRDVMYSESKDFVNWTDPKQIEFTDDEDIALYTNNVIPYFRAPQLYIGTPTRYIERVEWNGSFEELGGRDRRKRRMEMHVRYGLTVTDCIFMVSRDGKKFSRFDGECFMPPEPENGRNWIYGDCYPSRGFAVTPSIVPDSPDELSIYVQGYSWMVDPVQLIRYSIRMDGFASLHAAGKETIAVTKPLIYDGKDMFINFATSAMGYLYVTLIDAEGNRYPSCETFGNTVDRRVVFDDPEAVAKLSGKIVTIEFRMRDGDVYSMQFR